MEIIGDFGVWNRFGNRFRDPFEEIRSISKSFVEDREDVIEVGDAIPVGDWIPFPKVKPIGNIPVSRVTKQIETVTRQRALLIEINYTDIVSNETPSFRILPSNEQTMEPYNSGVQYLLFSARGCQTIAFKVPNIEIVEAYQQMDCVKKKYKIQVYFKGPKARALIQPQVPPFHAQLHGMEQLLPPP